MDHQLRAAGLVEKALEHNVPLRRQQTQRRLRGTEIFDNLRGCFLCDSRWALGSRSSSALSQDISMPRDASRVPVSVLDAIW